MENNVKMDVEFKGLPPREAIEKLAEALAKAQGEMQPAAFDRTNPHFKNKYATLASVWDSIRAPLARNGLAVVQITQTQPDGLYLVTELVHSSGQRISSEMKVLIGAGPNPMQSMGAALTYARRYSLSALVGAVSDEDNDGNDAAPEPTRREKRKEAYEHAKQELDKLEKEIGSPEERAANAMDQRDAHKPKVISAAQGKRLFAIANGANWPTDELKKLIQMKAGVESSKEIPWTKYEEICDFVEKHPYSPDDQA